MASEQNRHRILYLLKYFQEKSDEKNGVSIRDMQSDLLSKGINADRRTLYRDIEELRSIGYDIIAQRGKGECLYFLASRDFELAELKLLVDAVQSFKFMTEKKSRNLIDKLKSLVSEQDALFLEQHTTAGGQTKSLNEEVYYNVDRIHTAIRENRQIRFQYFQWTVSKEMALRHGGDWYYVSPWGLLWDDENYYLIAYDSENREIRHYRVDKMLHIETQEQERDGEEQFDQFDIGSYSRKMFGMFGGDPVEVKLLCSNDMAGVMIDRFGTGVRMVPVNAEQFYVLVDVVVSEQFLGWVISLGEGVTILEPESAVKAMKETVKRLNKQYPEG